MPLISIIIRTKNEQANLAACLEMIKKQTIKDFEIIVVDSGSTDKTVDIAREYNCKIISITPEQFTYGYALNAGIRSAVGDVAVLISAHCLPYNQLWLELLIKPFSTNSKLAGVYGRQIPFPDASPVDRRGLNEAYPEDSEFRISQNFRFSNAHAAILKKSWQQIPFNEQLPFAEDVEWSKKIRNLGYNIGYEPRSIVFHSHKESIAQIYKRFFREKVAFIKMGGEFAVQHGIIGYAARYFRSLVLDYLFLITHPNTLNYFIKWLILLPFYRIAIYYGQYRATK